MNDMDLDTKSRILQHAIDLVGSKGQVTIRELTEKAGTNIASINYYFGSKDNLLKEVEKYYSTALYNAQYKVLTSMNLSPQEKLLEWAKTMANFISKYPALIGFIAKLTTENKDYTPVVIEKIYLNHQLQTLLQEIIASAIKTKNQKLVKLKYLQLFSGILGPAINRLVQENFANDCSVLNLSSKEDLEDYMKLLIDGVLA